MNFCVKSQGLKDATIFNEEIVISQLSYWNFFELLETSGWNFVTLPRACEFSA